MAKHKKLRVFAAVGRLSPDERKKIFAANLDAMLKVIGLPRKEAASLIGIQYKLIRRLVSSGISRLDDRNIENVTKIIAYFGLRDPEELWQPELLTWLLNPDYGKEFTTRFSDRLTMTWDQLETESSQIDDTLRKLIYGGVRLESPIAEYGKKIEVIFNSSKAKQFKRLIDDYHEFVSQERDAG